MFTIWIVFHIIICIALVVVVLLQSSKGEGLAGSAFGGGGGGGGMSGAVFGGRGAASFLSRLTTVFAVVFMLNCGGLAFLSATDRVTFSDPTAPAESVVTREAQKERDQALQLQQEQQQQQSSDSALESIQIVPNEAADQQNQTPTTTEDPSGN